MNIQLKPMTDEMYHSYAKEFENDPDLFENIKDYTHYVYSIERANSYLKRIKEKNRIIMAVLNDDEIIGEIIFKNIIENESLTLGITMKNPKHKDKGYGTIAEKMAIKYAFDNLNVRKIYADCLISNKRSEHVLKKVGFKEIRRDERFVYFEFDY